MTDRQVGRTVAGVAMLILVVLLAPACGLDSSSASDKPQDRPHLALPVDQQTKVDSWFASVGVSQESHRRAGFVVQSDEPDHHWVATVQLPDHSVVTLGSSGNCSDGSYYADDQLAQLVHTGDGISWSTKGNDETICLNEIDVLRRGVA